MTLSDARIFHVNVNCSSLDAALRFWADGLGLTPTVRTTPETAQPGAAFGLDRARWDAWILTGRSGFEGGAVDLLEWHEPPPCGAPAADLRARGLQRVGVSVPDLEAAIGRIRAAGGRVWSEPFAAGPTGAADVRLVFASDPDGTAVELIERRGAPALSFVAVTCADLDASLAWYEALGFAVVGRYASHTDDASHLGLTGPASFTEVMLRPAGGGEVLLGLMAFEEPKAQPQSAAQTALEGSAASVRPANSLGLWRVALLVSDLDAARKGLQSAGIDSFVSEPVTLAMGPGLPEVRFVCLRGRDGEVLELIEHPA